MTMNNELFEKWWEETYMKDDDTRDVYRNSSVEMIARKTWQAALASRESEADVSAPVDKKQLVKMLHLHGLYDECNQDTIPSEIIAAMSQAVRYGRIQGGKSSRASEAVAWMLDDDTFCTEMSAEDIKHYVSHGIIVTPLFTHPTQSDSRESEAVEIASNPTWIEDGENNGNPIFKFSTLGHSGKVVNSAGNGLWNAYLDGSGRMNYATSDAAKLAVEKWLIEAVRKNIETMIDFMHRYANPAAQSDEVKRLREGLEIANDSLTVAYNEEIRRLREDVERACEWRQWGEFSSIYDTQCGGSWTFEDGDCKDNGVSFCPYCGGLIKEIEESA